jgi:hypothetical protein
VSVVTNQSRSSVHSQSFKHSFRTTLCSCLVFNTAAAAIHQLRTPHASVKAELPSQTEA